MKMVNIEVLIPLVLPFVIGLIVGLLARTMLKVAVGILALAILLPYAGSKGFPSIRDLLNKAMENLPQLIKTGQGWADALPYTAPPFIVGVVIGIFWGH